MLELFEDSTTKVAHSAATIHELLQKQQVDFNTAAQLSAAQQFETELQLLLQALRHSITAVASCSAQIYAALTRIDQ